MNAAAPLCFSPLIRENELACHDPVAHEGGVTATALTAIDQRQRTAARTAGFLYLLLGALAAFVQFYIRSGILMPGHVAQTAHNILVYGRLFRIGMALDLIGGAGNAALAVAFYVMLKPVGPATALLAAFWRLAEAVILGHMTLNSMVAVHILRHADRFAAFSTAQLQALTSIYLGTQGAEFSIGLLFYALGSTLFCYLLLKSRYIPIMLAWWGLLGSVVALLSSLTIIVFPAAAGIAPSCYIPVGTFEIVAGFWLLLRGIRQPLIPDAPTVNPQPG